MFELFGITFSLLMLGYLLVALGWAIQAITVIGKNKKKLRKDFVFLVAAGSIIVAVQTYHGQFSLPYVLSLGTPLFSLLLLVRMK